MLPAVNFSAPVRREQASLDGNRTGWQGTDRSSKPLFFPGDPQSDTTSRQMPQQSGNADEGVASEGDGYRFNFEGADVNSIAKAVLGDVLNVNYLVDKRVAGEINLTSSQPIPKARVLSVFEAALAGIGAALIKEHDLYRVVPMNDTGGMIPVSHGDIGEGFGTSVIKAKYVPASSLAHLLEVFGSRPNSVKADDTANLIVIQGTASERRIIAEAAESVDVDWLRSRSVAILPVTNASPEVIIAEMNKILDSGEGGLGHGAFEFQPMTRLNAILVVARQATGIRLAAKWVARLDHSGMADFHMYRLQYAQAKTVAATLNDLFTGKGGMNADAGAFEQSAHAPTTSSTAPASALQAGASDSGPMSKSGTTTPFGSLPKISVSDTDKHDSAEETPAAPASSGSSKVHVVADVSNNSLLIDASASDYTIIERALHEMDRQPLQVDIEATIAEVTLDDDLKFGVQFYLQKGHTGFGLSGASGFPLTSVSAEGAHLILGGLSDPKVLLDALQSKTAVKILSSPSLVVVDRQPAVLQVGDQVPILTRTAQSVDTTSAPIVNNVDYKDTGVILNVLPRVGANGIVNLDIEQQISSVSSSDASTTLTPTISQRRVHSSIAIANGQTVMLAGLISDRQSQTRSGLPGLGSLRFLNDLLTSHETLSDRTEILIFIKPTIISNPFDAEQVSEEFHNRLTAMRRSEAVRPLFRKD